MTATYRIDDDHWWGAGMRRITRALLAGVALPPGPLLEIGCGSGALVRELADAYPDRLVFGSDLRPNPAVSLLLRSDLNHLPHPDRSFAAVLALDSFDQRGVNLAQALAESWRVLRTDGILLCRVSAYPWLFGPHDSAFGTGQRYTAPTLRRALIAARFHPLRLTYANSFLLSPAIVLRLLQRRHHVSVQNELQALRPLNRPLTALLAAEAHWLRRRDFAAGLSLYAIAVKADKVTG